MNHQDSQQQVHDYLRGTLEGAHKDRLERHAEECTSCREYMKSCQELTCREFVDFLHAYLDKDLPEKSRVVFDRHLARCPDCTNYLHSYRETIDLSVAAMSRLASREIPEDLVSAILKSRDQG